MSAAGMLLTKEHYDLMASFEREHKHCRLDRERDKELWKRGHVYQDGHVNELFIAYRKGYALGLVSGDAADKLAAAPVAIMDTRAALGLCAPTEDDFPALEALKGRRVALVDLGPHETRKVCTCDGAGRGPGRACVVKAGGRLGELWRCADGLEAKP